MHEVKGNRNLKELDCASGGNWGGTSVDMAFKQALAEIVTEEIIEGYCHKYTGDYIELLRDFEIKKRKCGIRNDSNPFITLKVPVTFTDECEKLLGKDLTSLTNQSRFKNNFFWNDDKVRIDLLTFEGFFKPACDAIIKHVEGLFKSPKVKSVKKILMVGGFSESPLLQDAIRKAFPDCQVIVPQEAGLAVLRGAVVFGYNPKAIESRIAKYTYGLGTNVEFDPKKHIRSKKKVIDGKEYCTDVFSQHVEKGSELLTDVAQTKRSYSPLTQQQNEVGFEIYTTEADETPLYIDGCKHIGSFSAPVPEGQKKDRSVTVELSFGDTELTGIATVVKTGDIFLGVFELPEDEKRKNNQL